MPLNIRKPSKVDYLPLLVKLEKRLQGWKAKLISRAGKLQLVKSVLSSIPMYFMSCFKFPKWLINRIDVIRRQFLWTRDMAVRPIHLINWKVACLPVQCGGLGIVNLQLQNMALLLRWWWRLYSEDRKLWATYASLIYAVRHSPHRPLIVSSAGSFFWKVLISLRPIFSSASRFQICSGQRISFWFDNWNGQPLAESVSGPLSNRAISLYDAKQNHFQLFPSPLTLQHSQTLHSLARLIFVPGNDRLYWNLEASGQFSVKSVYRVLSQGGKILSDTGAIWKASVTPSMRFFFYLFINHRLLTHEVMLRRNLSYQPGCVTCDRRNSENALHLFFTCAFAARIWSSLTTRAGYDILKMADSLIDTYRASRPREKDRQRHWTTLFITAVWFIWRERNMRTFQHSSMPAHLLADRIWEEATLYLKYCK